MVMYLNVGAIDMNPHFSKGNNISINMSVNLQQRMTFMAVIKGEAVFACCYVTSYAIPVHFILLNFLMNQTRPKESPLQEQFNPFWHLHYLIIIFFNVFFLQSYIQTLMYGTNFVLLSN